MVTGPLTCTVTTAFGADLDAELIVVATDRFATARTDSVALTFTGRLTVPLDELPGGKPDLRMPEQP